MKRSDAFPSKYLTRKFLQELGQDLVVTIAEVVLESFTDQNTGEAVKKPVAYFVGDKAKPLILNATNYDFITDMTGTEDTDAWAGTRIRLTIVREKVFNKMDDVLRVAAPASAAPRPQVKAAAPKPDSEEEDFPF